MTTHSSTDLIVIGRTCVDLYGQQIGGRLEDVRTFAKYVGGCAANIATGTSRLGMKSALLTRVGDDHMGRFILEQLNREGVSVDQIVSDPERMTALAFVGVRSQEEFPLLFYREDCADMALSEEDIDAEQIASARAIVIAATHYSAVGTAAALQKATEIAKQNGTRVVIDIDYRPVLWGLTAKDEGESRFVASDRVTQALQPAVPYCDLIVGTEEEICILGGKPNVIDSLKQIRELTTAPIVCKLGPKGCVVFDGTIPDDVTAGIHGTGFPIEVYNVLGAGDAFMSGFLRGWLRDEPIETCCTWANACGALVVSRHGCAPAIPTWNELQYFLENGSEYHALRKDAALEHMHKAETRTPRQQDSLAILAFDHRSQFEALAERQGADSADISRFKRLACEAVSQLAPEIENLGIIADAQYAREVLEVVADGRFWVGRPIEQPGSRPVQFVGSEDVAVELSEWPRGQTIKCLVFYDPSDSQLHKDEQLAQLRRLYAASNHSGHELMLEIVCDAKGASKNDSVVQAIREIYACGVKPDWWKLEAPQDHKYWSKISEEIDRQDKHCRGIVVLGLAAPLPELKDALTKAAQYPAVRGFAVGRTIFANAAEAWLSGRMSDDAAVDDMKGRFRELAVTWRDARAAVEGK